MKLNIFFVVLLSCILASCSNIAYKQSEDVSYSGSGPSEPIHQKKENYAVMNVFFATDRKEDKNANLKLRFGKERGDLIYGVTQISIPRKHEMGELESPSIWRFEFRENPKKHIVMLGIENLNKESYFQAISQKVKNSTKKSAFLFIHGFNVTFEDAARRTGQIYYDLGFDGVAAFYSWPSHGIIKKYVSDEANIEWSQRNIEMFLKDFAEKSDAENIYLIAHSMGNRALTRAYISLVDNNPILKSRIKEIILAAPDIDAAVFKEQIAPMMIQARIPITLYSSSEDIPLKLSKTIHGYSRAGESGENLVVLPGIETIDATNVNTSFFGHSIYAEERELISDIFYIFQKGLRANERAGLKQATNHDGVYWQFKK